MRYGLPVIASLAVLAMAGAVYVSVAAGGPANGPFVAGGGEIGPGTFPDGFELKVPRDFGLDAQKTGARVTGIFNSGQNGVSSTGTDVTCVAIEGNRAAVGGVDTADPTLGRVRFLIDNGPPGSAIRDQLSPTFTAAVSDPSWPTGFPYVCPKPSSGLNDAGYLDVHSGDIVVSNGTR